ncbi:PilN domain-containing protein [Candidatus Parcubacteria bacterium]|nr:hypothetical protein [Patescibacteria group bacterium]MBU4482171.1 hypothetical protein [Patescibacteria group bacterium]MCG2686545.1 PilN domain-containing protein [Candidatus Parcubacteria bacterium]
MIILNLLPATDKKQIVNHYLILLIKDIVFSFLLICTVLAILFLICHFLLIKNFISISQQNLSVMTKTNLITGNIRQINSELKSLEKIQDQYTNWVQFITNLNAQIPTDKIQITKLNIDKHQQTLKLEGKTIKRDAFLDLKQNLENSKMFSSIKSPLSNLLSNKNLNFSLEIKFNETN